MARRFDRAGVAFSDVTGAKLPAAASERHTELAGQPFRAMGTSVVVHPVNPYAPTSHANVRLFTARGGEVWWFGGGFDLTPVYPFDEDARAWHQAARAACAPAGPRVYEVLKQACDRYFYLPHRGETRGIGGLFADDLNDVHAEIGGNFAHCFALIRRIGDTYLDTYVQIVKRRAGTPFGAREQDFQRLRRGRYVEFNLAFDRGTRFGLQSQARTESLLMSLPPRAEWRYDFQPGARLAGGAARGIPEAARLAGRRVKGVLLVNSGTPASLATRDVRAFLAGLLGDPRVVEIPRLLWWPILHGIILRVRPRASARKYAAIWTPAGSPLAVESEALRRGPGGRACGPQAFRWRLAMLYTGGATVPQAIDALRAAGVDEIVVVPMFPQYCGATTGAVFDQVTAALGDCRRVPALRFVAEYHAEPAYIEALARSVEDHRREHGTARHLLMSFHGIPERFVAHGDPYRAQCERTAALLAQRLRLGKDDWSVTFQSRFGRARWLQPYTIEAVAELAQARREGRAR